MLEVLSRVKRHDFLNWEKLTSLAVTEENTRILDRGLTIISVSVIIDGVNFDVLLQRMET